MKLIIQKSMLLVLSISVMLVSFPVNGFSQNLNAVNTQNAETHSKIEVSDVPTIASQLELIDRREENVKHFRRADGSIDAIVYGYAVHAKDKNGNWHDIDNRLFLDESNSKKYKTLDNRIAFASTADSGNILTISEDGYQISMGLSLLDNSIQGSNTMIINNTSTAKIFNHESREEQLSKIPTSKNQDEYIEKLKNINNKTQVVYSNVYSGIDLKYTLESNSIKEYITVNSPMDEYSYHFSLKLTGLTAKLLDNRSISLYDTNTLEEKYQIPAPFMFDAANEISSNVSYDLVSIKDGVYILSIIADSNWINHESRSFPVIIDPSLQKPSIFYDTYINSSSPTTNYGYDDELWISSSRVSFIKANIDSIPTGSEIKLATLNVAYYYYSNVTDGYLNAGVYQVVKPWSESSLTWNIANQNNNMGLSTTLVSKRAMRGDNGAYIESPQWRDFLVTSLVQSWVNGSPNYGVALKYEDGTKSSVILCSYEFGAGYCAYFRIHYEDPISSGVYMIYSQHFGTSSPKIMDTTGGDKGYSLSGDEIQTWSTTASELIGTRSKRAQLYKITKLSNSFYTIRPMTNTALGLAADGNGVKALDGIGPNDVNSIEAKYCWEISYNYSTGYTFENLSTGKYISISATGTNGAAVELISDSSDSKTHWEVLEYTGNTDSMRNLLFNLDGSHIVPMGGSFDISNILNSCFFYSHIIGENVLPVTLSAQNYSGQTSSIAYISGSSLIGYANKAGMVNLKIQFGSGTSQIVKNFGFYFQPPNDTHFYLQNVRPSNGLEYGFVQPHATNTTAIKSDITFSPEQAWQLERLGSNTQYCLIKNVSTGKYLTSPATTLVDTIVSMSNLLPYVTSGGSTQPDPRQLWIIESAPSGSGGKRLRSQYMVNSGVNLCLAVRSSDNVLMQGAYVNNNSYLDEFNTLFFGNDVVFQRAHPYDPNDFYEGSYNSTLNYLSKQYDKFMLVHKTVPITYDTAISLVENSKITVFCGHANATEFNVSYYNMFSSRPSSSLKLGKLYNTDLYNNGIAQANLSGVDIIIFAGCEAAGSVSSGYNLANSAHKAGAQVSIGWADLTTSELFDWINYFFEALDNGNTSNAAKIYADGKMKKESSKTSIIYGNGAFKFN